MLAAPKPTTDQNRIIPITADAAYSKLSCPIAVALPRISVFHSTGILAQLPLGHDPFNWPEQPQ
jgi:hypothetical protein